MGYFTCVVFVPEQVPYENLGPLGSFSKYMANNHHGWLLKGYWAAWAIHVMEASIAMRVCREKGVTGTVTRCLWFIQTMLFGFASLGLLIKYKPDRPNNSDRHQKYKPDRPNNSDRHRKYKPDL